MHPEGVDGYIELIEIRDSESETALYDFQALYPSEYRTRRITLEDPRESFCNPSERTIHSFSLRLIRIV